MAPLAFPSLSPAFRKTNCLSGLANSSSATTRLQDTPESSSRYPQLSSTADIICHFKSTGIPSHLLQGRPVYNCGALPLQEICAYTIRNVHLAALWAHQFPRMETLAEVHCW